MNGLIPFRDGQYIRSLRFLMTRPWLLLVAVVMLLILSGWAATELKMIVFPDSEEPYFTVTLEADRDRSTQTLQNLAHQVRDVVEQEPEVERCSTILGATFPAVHTGIRWLPNARNVGTVFCQVNFRDSVRMNQLTVRLNQKLVPLQTDVKLDAAAFINGDGVDDPDIALVLSGQSNADLREEARRLGAVLRQAAIPGVLRIDNPAESIWFALDIRYRQHAANALGVSRAAVDQVISLMTHGIEVDEYRLGSGDTLPIMLKVDTEIEQPLAIFDRLFVSTSSGEQVPLSQVVETSFTEDEYDIYHRQFEPELNINIHVDQGYDLIEVRDAVHQALTANGIADGIRLEYGGKLAVSEDAFGETGRYVGIIGLMILGIFVLQFRSILQPLIVFAAIPLSFIGGFLLLWVTNQPLSFLAFVGLTSLMGIVINNSILLVDEGNRLRRENPDKSLTQVAIEAGTNRFMPVVLTTLTTLCGLLPLALGDSMFKPLAIVVIGGLATSTVLTLVCVPVLFARLGRH